MPARRAKRKVPELGSRVKLKFGVEEVTATVIEDRGDLAVGGGPLLRVALDIPDDRDPIELEIPADNVKPAPAEELDWRLMRLLERGQVHVEDLARLAGAYWNTAMGRLERLAKHEFAVRGPGVSYVITPRGKAALAAHKAKLAA